MGEEVFRFKHFEVSHAKSSMKVGVDAVLLGAWAGKNPRRILDVGTGCGVIAMILKQRFPEAQVVGIDIDSQSVAEAETNFKCSNFEGIKAIECEFPEGLKILGERYDLIVSNPPYFDAGIEPSTRRERARHQDSLSVAKLLENVRKFMERDGRLAVIFPTSQYEETIEKAKKEDLKIIRECFVKNNIKRPEKRVLLELGFNESYKGEVVTEHLTLFDEEQPTLAHRELCKDLYLKF